MPHRGRPPAVVQPLAVNLLRADEPPEAVIRDLMEGMDMVIPFDAADRRVGFAVNGFFCIPRRAMLKSTVTSPA